GGVAARPSQAINKTRADRVGDVYEYDRHGARRLQQWRHDRVAGAKDDVRRERGQLLGVLANVGCVTQGPAITHLHVAADEPTQWLHPLLKRLDAGLRVRIAGVRPPERRLIRRIPLPCCARAASGHAAAPPSSDMNTRRLLTRPPRRRGRASYRAP